MIKHFYFCFAFVFFQVVCYSQQIGTFKFQEKKYLVYPFRINEGTEIPVLGFKIPDGEYVAFHDYTFKEKKLSFKKNKKHVLTDTAKVTAVFIIKNNIPDGKATFYQYGEPKDNGKLKKHPESMDEGVFANGLKQGGWKTIEFENKKDYVDASETVTNYNKGVKEGYEYIYNDKHELDKKQKWHLDELCDTVFNYLNGKLYTEYDVCPRNEINYKISVYKKALKLLNINNLDNIKSYYKEYLYPSSKVVYNLKYNNGVILPFDSLGEQYTSTLCGEHYYFKYVTIKHPTINEDVVCYFSKNDIDTSITLIKFKNEEEYYRKEERIDYKYKTHRFSKRQTVISKEYDFAESYKNIDSLDKNSVLPVLIEKTTDIYKETDFSKKEYEWEQKPTTKRVYLIPKYGYAYNTNQYDTLIQIDTLKRALYLISTNTESSVLKKQNTIRSVSPHTDVQEGLKLNPFLEKDYLTNVSIRLFEQPSKLNYINDVGDFIKEPFSETNISYALSYKDTLLNGIYCISRFGEPKKPLSYVTYIDSYMTGVGNRTGNYKNGKEDGLFQELNLNSSLKRIPADFKTYFFNHPHLFNSYVEQEYQQGLRHGKQTFYQSIDTTSRYGKKSRRKDFTTFKEHEVTFVNDTIDGIFKSFYPNGKLETELFFNRGRVNGDYKEYNEQGNQSGVMHFENGALHGECVQYFENNTYSKSPNFYANFNHNALKDSAIFYNHFSKLPSMAIYVRNDTMLAKKMYYPDGKLKEAVLFNKSTHFKIEKKIVSSDNFNTILNSLESSYLEGINAHYVNYYDNGQLLSEGNIVDGYLFGAWKFYNINGTLIHEVVFNDTTIALPNDTNLISITGFYKGYYANGIKRCEGYLSNLDLDYDCFTKQDKAVLDFYVLDFFDINGKQTIKQGNGYFVKYDPNGVRISSGKLVNCREDSLWRYYTPEQKLTETGAYILGKKDGVWYSGDLEAINFEDGACFDLQNKFEAKEYEEKRKELTIEKRIYDHGKIISSSEFYSNTNKTYNEQVLNGW